MMVTESNTTVEVVMNRCSR